jgi:hypothetical protein
MRLSSRGLRVGPVSIAVLFWCGAVQAQGAAQAPGTSSTSGKTTGSFWQAASALVAINGGLWFYNWQVQGAEWADVGTRSWWTNLQAGFNWDDDVFGVNQVAHPYHGSLYFNAARASGYGFWGSTPFVAAGSLSWELFWENVRPSANDLINTTLGGIALGEVAHRISSHLLTRRGFPAGRRMGALVVNPVGQAQSLVHGDDRAALDSSLSTSAFLAVGRQSAMGAEPQEVNGEHPFLGLTFQYGSAFDEHVKRPYDAFEFSLHLSPNQYVVLTHAAVSGLLTRRKLAMSPRRQLMLGLYQHYDYDDMPLAKASSQSLSGALLYRQNPSGRTQLDLGLHLEVVPLGAISTEHDRARRRDYDFGPGAGVRITGAIRHNGRELLRVDGRTVWIHSLYASDADHYMTTARLRAMVPLFRMVSAGGDVSLTLRRSRYATQPSVSARLPQVRAYLIWSPS